MIKKFIYIGMAFISILSCNKDLNEANIESYKYTNLDANGGSWKPILVSKPEDITVNTPVEVTNDEFKILVSDMLSFSANATQSQLDSIKVFGGNSLVKWNDIARALAAKYNLPPAANSDGTYPAPSSINPGVYPYFPFANPPYASRAFAYWSAAQFDGMIVTWYYKYKFNRPAVYNYDNTITSKLPKQDLPGGISEDAVIATISKEMLSFLFPLEASYLDGLANTHKNSRIWAKMNTKDEIEAGTIIGKQIADKFIAKAKGDGMGKAAVNVTTTDSIGNVAFAKFGWKWKSLESPVRPGLLPQFGKVKMWCIPNVELVRPPEPPAPTSDEFKNDVAEMLHYTKNQTDESRRIANFWADGPSSSTPPGHWNQIASEQIALSKLNPIRSARVFAYMNMAIEDAGIACWDAKYYYFTPRPTQIDPNIKTLIGLPNFPGYISGHSTFSSAGATVLSYFFPTETTKFNNYANDASNSRIYGCIHFRHDCKVGLEVGKNVGQYSLGIAKVDGAQ